VQPGRCKGPRERTVLVGGIECGERRRMATAITVASVWPTYIMTARCG
jgi:hypothetical protein